MTDWTDGAFAEIDKLPISADQADDAKNVAVVLRQADLPEPVVTLSPDRDVTFTFAMLGRSVNVGVGSWVWLRIQDRTGELSLRRLPREGDTRMLGYILRAYAKSILAAVPEEVVHAERSAWKQLLRNPLRPLGG